MKDKILLKVCMILLMVTSSFLNIIVKNPYMLTACTILLAIYWAVELIKDIKYYIYVSKQEV